MWHLTACKISVSLSFMNWIKNEMIFYCVSELFIVGKIISEKQKNIILFLTQVKNERLTEILQAVRYHIL